MSDSSSSILEFLFLNHHYHLSFLFHWFSSFPLSLFQHLKLIAFLSQQMSSLHLFFDEKAKKISPVWFQAMFIKIPLKVVAAYFCKIKFLRLKKASAFLQLVNHCVELHREFGVFSRKD